MWLTMTARAVQGPTERREGQEGDRGISNLSGGLAGGPSSPPQGVHLRLRAARGLPQQGGQARVLGGVGDGGAAAALAD